MGSLAATGSGQRHRRLGSTSPQAKSYLHGNSGLAVATGSTPASSEGINNTIKSHPAPRLRLRDQEYFFLKIRSAFPGIPR
ncbi:putative iSBma1, transposase [Bordetella holmesii 30539]|nr:putative iSBma1, transposase [Bordetella holmesii 30539]